MIIHHSFQLLQNLSEIEQSIQPMEQILKELGLEEDAERILLAIMVRKKACLLADKENN